MAAIEADGTTKAGSQNNKPPLVSIDFPTEVPIEAQEVALGTVLVVALVVEAQEVALGAVLTGLKKLKIKVC